MKRKSFNGVEKVTGSCIFAPGWYSLIAVIDLFLASWYPTACSFGFLYWAQTARPSCRIGVFSFPLWPLSAVNGVNFAGTNCAISGTNATDYTFKLLCVYCLICQESTGFDWLKEVEILEKNDLVTSWKVASLCNVYHVSMFSKKVCLEKRSTSVAGMLHFLFM